MDATDALKRTLSDLTRLYAGDRVEVRFDDQPHYAGPNAGGPYLAVNPDVNGWYEPDPPVSGANELRLLRDTLSHEAYEYRMGNPDAKAAFIARHGDADPDDDVSSLDYDKLAAAAQRAGPKGAAAGQIYNILRDAWVNSERCRDFPGLRRTFAFKADLLAGEVDVSEVPAHEALLAGLHQIALTNTANGIRDADDEVRKALSWARSQVEQARRATGHPDLMAVADRVFERFEPLLPDTSDESFEDLLDRLDSVTTSVDMGDDMDAQDVANTINLADVPDDVDIEIDTSNLDAADLPDDGPTRDDHADPDDLPEDVPESFMAGDADDADPEDYYDLPEDAQGGAHGDAGDDEGQDTDAGGDGLPDDLADLLDDMDDLDASDRPAGDMHDLDDADDYHEPDAGECDRYENVRDEARFESTSWSDRMSHRDNYSKRKASDLDADEIRELMRETGLAKDIRRAFDQIKTRQVTRATKRRSSRLNLNNVVRHMAGDYGERRVYEETERGASGGRTVCAVMDASSSMSSSGSIGTSRGAGGAIVDAKVALAALHIASHQIGDDLVANAFDTSAPDNTRLVTGPDESFEWEHLDGFTSAGGATPLAAGVMDGARMLDRAGGAEHVMLVITDGKANTVLGGPWENMSEGDPTEDARKAVQHAREEGVTVIGIGVGSGVGEAKLGDMFGPDSWVHVEADTLVRDLVRIYREQLDDDRVAQATI